jgi:L-lactate dehydrogenase complex protein LldG
VSDARDEVLGRVRRAIAGVPAGEPPAWDPAGDLDPEAAYDRDPMRTPGLLPDLFAERAAEYDARITRVNGTGELAEAIGAIAARHGATRLAVARGLEPSWLPEGLDLVEEPELSVQGLDEVDGVITSSALAIARTGTIVLDGGPGQGPRRLTLVPDLHVCVVEGRQVVGTVPEAIQVLKGAAEAGRPLTFVSGPSATSDIELERVQGVHGPRRLEVVLVDEPQP